jgi:hypothetical protein
VTITRTPALETATENLSSSAADAAPTITPSISSETQTSISNGPIVNAIPSTNSTYSIHARASEQSPTSDPNPPPKKDEIPGWVYLLGGFFSVSALAYVGGMIAGARWKAQLRSSNNSADRLLKIHPAMKGRVAN